MYLAVADDVCTHVFESGVGELVRSDVGIRLVVVNVAREEVVRWVS
jgi:hypothetical protein